MSTHDRPTVILGAGLCGLSAAYHLEQQGRTDYLLLEREAEVGGLARTARFDGFSFDHAIHILYSANPYAIDLICNRLLKGNLCKSTRRSYCHTAGTYTEYPYQLNNRGLPAAVIVENVMGLIEARYDRSQDGPPPHFEAWIYRTYGQGIAKNFMIPYNRRQWAWDLREMNYEWIADRVPVPEIREVIQGALQPQQAQYGPNQEFWYPIEGGIQALPLAFLRYLSPGRLWTRAAVVAVDANRQEVLLADGRRLGYQHLISTIPLPTLVGLLGDAVPVPIRRCGAALNCNVVHTVNIGLEGTDLPDIGSMHWIYFPEDTTVFHRISLPRNFSSRMVPPGCSSIQLEISESRYRPCERSTLIQQGLDGLVRVGILQAREARPVSEGGRVRVSTVVTLDPAYVIYGLAHRENTQTIKSYLKRLDISTSGRFGEWEYLNMDHAVLRGKAAAESSAGWATDDP